MAARKNAQAIMHDMKIGEYCLFYGYYNARMRRGYPPKSMADVLFLERTVSDGNMPAMREPIVHLWNRGGQSTGVMNVSALDSTGLVFVFPEDEQLRLRAIFELTSDVKLEDLDLLKWVSGELTP